MTSTRDTTISGFEEFVCINKLYVAFCNLYQHSLLKKYLIIWSIRAQYVILSEQKR